MTNFTLVSAASRVALVVVPPSDFIVGPIWHRGLYREVLDELSLPDTLPPNSREDDDRVCTPLQVIHPTHQQPYNHRALKE